MAAKDQRRQFEDIVARLTADDPDFAETMRAGRSSLSTAARVTLAVAGAIVWGLLSVLMVAWRTPGVILTIAVVLVTLAVAITRERRNQRL
ncbi:DUF3040 domain-containing protein [Symbioplanes lichenis]|uniref:DUF3040 domain-containing protein n=1 Tax=Symbioplanes lichenis TaxID=1629072 RepID=UPI00273A3D4F|nr:DUF3040 domain-containing protein [Actinoplanes lichenis]